LKATHFKDQFGKTLVIAFNVENSDDYPPIKDFPEGWTAEVLTEEEARKLIPESNDGERRFPDSLHERVEKLKLRHEALIEILGDTLKLKKGDLEAMIAEKMKGGSKDA
jgi:hypothetical protein